MLQNTLAQLRAWLRAAPLEVRRRTQAIRLGVERLEDRLTPSAGLREQYMLELINRMRENPAAELPLLLNSGDPNVQSALAYFDVDITVLQNQWNTLVAAPPLAWNDNLAAAAVGHNQAMFAAGQQGHQVAGEAPFGTRITNAGYNWSNIAENVFASADSVFQAHAAFAIDWGNTSTGIQSPPGHRQNIMSTNFRDIGIGILDAPGNPNVGPLLITQDFGNRFSYGNPNLLGVVFNDANANGYYDQGEGLSGVTLTITGTSGPVTASTTAFGGYQIALAAGSYTVVATGGGLNAPVSRNVTIASSNVRANFINGSQPPQNAPVPFADDFNRANSSTLGTFWQQHQGRFDIANNQTIGGTTLNMATLHGVALADMTVQADVNVGNTIGRHAGLVVRQVNAGNYYVGLISRKTTGFAAQIYRVVNGVMTLRASMPLATGTGTLRFDVAGSSLKLYFGANASSLALVTFAYDSSVTAAGSAGIRTSQGAAIDNFALDSITTPTSQTLPFTDAFNANPPTQQLSVNWRERAGNLSVAGGAALVSAPGISIATVNGTALADVSVQADTVVGPGQFAGLVARYQSNGSFYHALLVANAAGTTFTPKIYRYFGGVLTQLNAAVPAITLGAGTLRFEVVGASLKLFFGQSLLAYAFDTKITAAGQVGLRGSMNARFDDFDVNAIVPTNAAIPFADPFTQTDGAQLARTWTERAGNFGVAGNQLIANGPSLSIATVNGPPSANVSVLADVALGAKQSAGLIARYQSNGSYYLGQVVANSTGTGVTFYLYRYASGVYTRLAMTSMTTTGTGTLRLEVVGTSLQLFFGSTLVASAVDATISNGGLTGIHASKGAALDNISVD